jgi:hypothetical protein
LTPDREDRIVTVSEAQRRALHDGLVKKLGADVADTLMDYLPPAGWSDLARRSDLEAMELRLEAKLADKINSQTKWFMASQLVLVAATIGSITTIAH